MSAEERRESVIRAATAEFARGGYHGTSTEAIRVVTDWTGDPGAVLEYGVRFTRPVVVPNDDQGATIEVAGKVAAKLDDNTVRVDLTATSGGQKVLGMSRAVVRLA